MRALGWIQRFWKSQVYCINCITDETSPNKRTNEDLAIKINGIGRLLLTLDISDYRISCIGITEKKSLTHFVFFLGGTIFLE